MNKVASSRGWGPAIPRLPVLDYVLALPGRVVVQVAAVPRSLIRAGLDEVFGYLAEADLTSMLLRAIDFDRVLGAVDLNALLARVDLNALLADVDLDALLAGVDLNAVLDGVDLNALLADVDLNALLADVDLNPVIARLDLNPALADLQLQALIEAIDLNKVLEAVDIDAMLARTDLVATASTVVDGIDLNNIVREASASVTTEMITDVRSGSERADDKVDQFIGRILRRKAATVQLPEQPHPERETR